MKPWCSPWPPQILFAPSHPPQTPHLDILSHCPSGNFFFTDSIAPSTSPDHVCILLKYIWVTPKSLFPLSSATSVWHISSLVCSDFLLTPLLWNFLELSKPCRSEPSVFSLSVCRRSHQCYRVISYHVAKILPISSGIVLCSCSSTSPSLRSNILDEVPSSPFTFGSPSLPPPSLQYVFRVMNSSPHQLDSSTSSFL